MGPNFYKGFVDELEKQGAFQFAAAIPAVVGGVKAVGGWLARKGAQALASRGGQWLGQQASRYAPDLAARLFKPRQAPPTGVEQGTESTGI